jgi:uncharacterized membrane protein YuzA (DUF378 family)
MAKSMRWYDWIAFWLVIIGALNWGFYGISRLVKHPFDLVTWAFSFSPTLANIVFAIVGLFGLVGIVTGIKLMIKNN